MGSGRLVIVGDNGWDSKTICHANIVSLVDRCYMFYCGKNCSETAFARPELQES